MSLQTTALKRRDGFRVNAELRQGGPVLWQGRALSVVASIIDYWTRDRRARRPAAGSEAANNAVLDIGQDLSYMPPPACRE